MTDETERLKRDLRREQERRQRAESELKKERERRPDYPDLRGRVRELESELKKERERRHYRQRRDG